MNSRDALQRLEGVDAFDSYSAAKKLGVSVVETSLTLMRLHRMGFLSRKVVPRVCVTKGGIKCKRGYQYVYGFTRKGRSYRRWLTLQKPWLDRWEREIIDSVARFYVNRPWSMSELSVLVDVLKSSPLPEKRLFDRMLFRLAGDLAGELKRERMEKYDLQYIIVDLERELQDTYASQREAVGYLKPKIEKGVRLWEIVDEELSVRRQATMYLFGLCAGILVAWEPYVPEPMRKAGLENALKVLRLVKTMLAERRSVDLEPLGK